MPVGSIGIVRRIEVQGSLRWRWTCRHSFHRALRSYVRGDLSFWRNLLIFANPNCTVMIRNLVFDFGGVIADFDFQQALAAFARIGLKNPTEYLDSYHQRDFFMMLESGAIDADEFVRRLNECSDRPVSYADAREAWMEFFLLPVPAERLAMLEELRRDYRLYVLSNTNPFVMSWARSSEFTPAGKPLDAYFDRLYLSCEMKCMKPDRAIFDRMAADAGLIPSETIYVDDSRTNADAGAALGYRVLCPKSNSDWRGELKAMLAAER